MRGFSLIEVLVALSIFAVLASTVVFQTGAFSHQLFRLEAKGTALWVAQNALDGARLAKPAPSTGGSDTDVEMAGKQWSVHLDVSETSRPGFRRVDVSVAERGEDASLITLTGFVADR